MKLFTAMEDYTCDSSLTYTLEELNVIEMNLDNEQRVLNSAVESYMDASAALKHLVKLEGLAPHNRGVYNVTMESINDQLGYPEGTVLSSEGVGSSISGFAKRVWAKIVAAWHAVRDWVRKLFGMSPIPSEGSLKKTDDTIKEAADKGPTIKTDDSKSGDDTASPVRNEQLEKDIINSATEEMKRVMVDIEKEVEVAAKEKADKMTDLAKKKAKYAEYEAQAHVLEQKYNDAIAVQVKKAKEYAELIETNLQKTYDNYEEQAHNMDSNRDATSRDPGLYERIENHRHPKAYDIEMGIALSTVLKASEVSIIMVTDNTTMSTRYATDDVKEIMPFLNDPTNTVMTEDSQVRTFDGWFDVGPEAGEDAIIHNVYSSPGGHWDVSYITTGERHGQIVANHKWFVTVSDKINSIMDKLTPEHFKGSEDMVKLTAGLTADLELVARKQIALMKHMDKNNKLVKALMEDTNEATYRYLQDHYIAKDTDTRNIKG